MSDVLKWLQNMANEEWEYEDGDYALEAIKFFNSLRADLAAERDRNGIITQAAQEVTNALRAENERLREALKETLAIARRNEAGDYVDRARAALEGVTEKSGAGNE